MSAVAQLTPPTSECICGALATHAGIGLPVVSEIVTDRTLDIANRLRFACAHMPPNELLALAMRMAIIEVKYACAWEPRAELPGV